MAQTPDGSKVAVNWENDDNLYILSYVDGQSTYSNAQSVTASIANVKYIAMTPDSLTLVVTSDSQIRTFHRADSSMNAAIVQTLTKPTSG